MLTVVFEVSFIVAAVPELVLALTVLKTVLKTTAICYLAVVPRIHTKSMLLVVEPHSIWEVPSSHCVEATLPIDHIVVPWSLKNITVCSSKPTFSTHHAVLELTSVLCSIRPVHRPKPIDYKFVVDVTPTFHVSPKISKLTISPNTTGFLLSHSWTTLCAKAKVSWGLSS